MWLTKPSCNRCHNLQSAAACGQSDPTSFATSSHRIVGRPTLRVGCVRNHMSKLTTSKPSFITSPLRTAILPFLDDSIREEDAIHHRARLLESSILATLVTTTVVNVPCSVGEISAKSACSFTMPIVPNGWPYASAIYAFTPRWQ